MNNKIQEVRKKKGISRYKMALGMNVSYNTMVNWEKSQSLGIDKIEKCAEYLKVDKTELI